MSIVEQRGNIVDVYNRRIFSGVVKYSNGIIISIEEENNNSDVYIMPGFIDSHMHIESTMLSPAEFAKSVVPRGTISVLADPHEIANVCGEEGLNYMLEDSAKVPLKIYYGIPSCVPATPFEINGATIDSNDIDRLFKSGKYKFLGEFMNAPGVVEGDNECIAKINTAKKYGYRIDGHAPGLSGEELSAYYNAGITTDHEYFSYENIIEKIERGLKIQIREGSASKDFKHLYKLIDLFPGKIMLCTDDSHRYDLINYGHIDKIVKMAVKINLDIFNILKAACIIPVEHYKLDVGVLKVGDKADFIVVKDLENFEVVKTIINGELVYDDGKVLFDYSKTKPVNNFNVDKISQEVLAVEDLGKAIKVITIEDGSLVSGKAIVESPKTDNGNIVSDIENDVIKMVLINRYTDVPVQKAFIKGTGLKKGAMASTIGHDSHNIIAIGSDDKEITLAVNKLIENKGGISVSVNGEIDFMSLNIAGLMSDGTIDEVSNAYENLKKAAKKTECNLDSPFMTMAFMSLIVIPELKLGAKGLFDYSQFDFVSLYE